MPETQNREKSAVIAFSAGGIILLKTLGILPMEMDELNVPIWVYGMCGLLFIGAGFVILLGK